MKKIISIVIAIVSIFILNINDIKAYDISASNTSLYVGDTVTVYYNASGMYGWIIGYSNNTGIINGGNTVWAEKYANQTYSFNFTAVQAGSTSLCVGPWAAKEDTWFENNTEFNDTKCVTVNVANRPTYNPIDVNPTYSSNNYLIELSIDGATITPDFDKETLEYSVELDSSVEKINIKAKTENSKASVVGAGEVEVNEGNNEIKLTVRAENGNERVYIINALVKEINPIEVEVNDKKYHIVKKESLLGEVEGFKKEMIEIYNEEIPALYNETTKYTLVALRDEKGNTSLFIYDKKDNSFTKFNEINVNGLRINVLDVDNEEYTKDEIEINDKKIVVYKKDKYKYYLIYGTNIETGKTSWYAYDKDENTLQRYIESKSNKTTKSDNKAIIILGSLLLMLSFFFTILSIKYKKGVSK